MQREPSFADPLGETRTRTAEQRLRQRGVRRWIEIWVQIASNGTTAIKDVLTRAVVNGREDGQRQTAMLNITETVS
eukprot:6210544-Pleurochrysis_carterae.AAC.6